MLNAPIPNESVSFSAKLGSGSEAVIAPWVGSPNWATVSFSV